MQFIALSFQDWVFYVLSQQNKYNITSKRWEPYTEAVSKPDTIPVECVCWRGPELRLNHWCEEIRHGTHRQGQWIWIKVEINWNFNKKREPRWRIWKGLNASMRIVSCRWLPCGLDSQEVLVEEWEAEPCRIFLASVRHHIHWVSQCSLRSAL